MQQQVPKIKTNSHSQRFEIIDRHPKVRQLLNCLTELNEKTGGVHEEEVDVLKGVRGYFNLKKDMRHVSHDEYVALGSMRHPNPKSFAAYQLTDPLSARQLADIVMNHYKGKAKLLDYGPAYPSAPSHIELAFSGVSLSSQFQQHIDYDEPPTHPILLISRDMRSFSLSRVYGWCPGRKDVFDLVPSLPSASPWVPSLRPHLS